MKKTLTKILAIALCAVLLVTGTIYITLAYLLDESNVVHNTFTVSKNIIITLDETKVNTDGTPVEGNLRENESQEYKLVPGASYTKDPTVHTDANSENCFIVIAIYDTIFKNADGEDTGIQDPNSTKVYDQLEANGWVELENCNILDKYFKEDPMAAWVARDGETIISHNYTLYYFAGIEGSEDLSSPIVPGGKDLKIFESFTLDGNVSFDTLKAFEDNGACFDVIAFGMQTSGYSEDFGDLELDEQIHTAFVNTFGVDTTPKTEPTPGPEPTPDPGEG